MSNFEAIVRPFQSRPTALPFRIFDGTARSVATVVLMLGKEGATKSFNESFSESSTSFQETESKELNRNTFTKRVENPDDSSQFVDVEVIKKLTLEQGEGRNYEKINMALKNEE